MVGWIKVQVGITLVVLAAIFFMVKDPYPAMVIVSLISILIMVPNAINAFFEELDHRLKPSRR